MIEARWNGAVIAASEHAVVVEGNHYFPRASVREEYLEPSETRTTCAWKGVASYYTLVVDGARNVDAAWVYREPEDAAREIQGHLAFWKGVEVG
jgi:uncharacterized protein (DUF427 family)